MKIAFISSWGLGLTLAQQMQDDGHDVRFWIEDKNSKDVGIGFVPHVDDWESLLEGCDYCVADDTHLTKFTDKFRAKGIPVVGGTKMTDEMESDRGAGQRMFKAVGLDVLESKEFKSIEDAIAYVQENPKPYVVKVSGTAQDDKTTSYVGQMDDGSDIVPVLKHMGERMEKGIAGVEVQEKVEGLEVGVGGIFNGEKFVGPCEIDWEHKKLMSWNKQQGIGPNTGEMGTVSIWADQKTPLFQKVIVPMIKPLRAMGFKGFFNINCIVAEDGKIHPLEQTNRFGWPTLPMEIETMKENDLGEFFYDVAQGKDTTFDVTYPLSLCVVIGTPPLPFMEDSIFEKYSKDMPVLFRNGDPSEGIYPGECKIVDGMWRIAGTSGCTLVCSSGGYSIDECRKSVYDLVDEVVVSNMMVRDDIGRTTEESYEKLKDLGLIEPTEEATILHG